MPESPNTRIIDIMKTIYSLEAHTTPTTWTIVVATITLVINFLLLLLLSMTFMAWHVTILGTQVCAKHNLWVSQIAVNNSAIFDSAT
jgi:hypothetical protein